VVVLHDLALAAAFADRIVVLRRGRLVADGPPEEVLRSELLSDVYEHHIEVVSSPIDGLPLALPIHHGALTL
jgi:iron complex transport system ATP-binding protein